MGQQMSQNPTKSLKRSAFRAETALQSDTCFVVGKVSDARKGGGASARGSARSPRLPRQGKVEVMHRFHAAWGWHPLLSAFRASVADHYTNWLINPTQFYSKNNPLSWTIRVPDDSENQAATEFRWADTNTVQWPVTGQYHKKARKESEHAAR